MKRHRYIHILAIVATLGAAGSPAAHAADGVTAPERPLSDRWTYTEAYRQTAPAADDWWATFGDPMLDSLLVKAQANNYNVAAAIKRIDLARKETDLARSAYWPDLQASAGWQKAQTAGATTHPSTPSRTVDYFSLGLNMNWEIDVFGRVSANIKAGKAATQAARADYDAVLVSLAANVAKAYFRLRTLQEQHAVALSHIQQQEKVLRMTEARFEAGIGDMLEVTQARIVLYSTKSTLPQLEAEIRTQASALAVLTGEYPATLAPTLLRPAPLPAEGAMPDVGIPADLLRRRPDIVAAEKDVARLAAEAGVARKDFLPTLSLQGSIATDSHDIDGLFGSHSLTYSVAPTLTWTIFDGLARNYRLAEARLQTEAAIDSYNLTVLNAVEEVENALSSYYAQRHTAALLADLVEESRKSVDLAVDRYKNGLSAFTNVVDALMSYLENQNSYVSARGSTLAALVTLYQALGGGPGGMTEQQ